MTAELPWCFSHPRPSASWAVAVAGRVGGVASARGCCCWRPTPHPHHAWAVDVARDSPVDGARAPPSSFCISLRPGMCQGERAGGTCNFSLLFALLSFSFLPFLQSLSYLRLASRSTRPHTIPRSLAPLCFASSCWNSGSPCEREPHPRSWVGIVGKKKIQEYEIAKLVTWWLLLFSLPLVTPRPEPAPLSEATDDDHHPPKPVAHPLTNHPPRRRGSTTKEIPTP